MEIDDGVCMWGADGSMKIYFIYFTSYLGTNVKELAGGKASCARLLLPPNTVFYFMPPFGTSWKLSCVNNFYELRSI